MKHATLKASLLVILTAVQITISSQAVLTVETNVEGCSVKGKVYQLGRPFSFVNGCYRYNCNCYRNGSFVCPPENTQDICRQEENVPAKNTDQSSSKFCSVRGHRYPLGHPFSFTDGCFKFNCDCREDASWDCPASRTQDICKEPVESEDGCTVKGKKYSLGQHFSFTDGCFKYNCKCKIDGSWKCPARRTENVCDQQKKEAEEKGNKTITYHRSVTSCIVKRKHYPLDRPFSFTNGCFKYNCECKPDGSYKCPAIQTENICLRRKEEHTKEEKKQYFYTKHIVLPVGTEVSGCEANGNNYPLDRSFSFREECVHYDCDCKPDGSWECPSERARYICAQSGESQKIIYTKSQVITIGTSASACEAKGRHYTLGLPFSFTDGCYRYYCDCKEDGSWECPASRAEDICPRGAGERRIGEAQPFYSQSVVISMGAKVKFCIAQGVEYPLGRPFSFTDRCFRFNCDCFSNGSWVCPADRANYICQSEPGEQLAQTSGRSMYIIPFRNARACIINGTRYPLSRTFSFTEGCFRHNCNCHKDGSWACPADRTQFTCLKIAGEHSREVSVMAKFYSRGRVLPSGSDVSHCEANGKTYELGRPFFFNDGCFRFNCQCKTDGSWECPADLSLYICQKQSGQIIENASSRSMYITVGDGVEMCTAKGKQYPLGTPFSFMDGCYEYNCDCQQDGSWDCPAERARNRCHHTVDQHIEPEQVYFSGMVVSARTRANYCIAERRRFPLNLPFSLTIGCYQYLCSCHSNGSWDCPAELAKFICPPQGSHEVDEAITRMMYVTISDDVRGCDVKGSQQSLGQSFYLDDGCYRYQCQCNSDGSWECPPEKARYTCSTDMSLDTMQYRIYSKSMVVALGEEIKFCKAKERLFYLGSSFTITEDCFRYNCFCYSDGSWECPADESEYICPQQQVRKTSSIRMYVIAMDNINGCRVNGREYPLDRPFSLTDECFRYDCECHSDGSWECPAENAEYICDKETSVEISYPRVESQSMVISLGSEIQHCLAHGKQYPLGQRFSFTDKCFRYSCDCRTDGSWECPADRSEFICPQKPGHLIERSSSQKMVVIVSENVRACQVRGHQYRLGQSFSFTEDCFKYNCDCKTDGSWKCPATQAEYICQEKPDPIQPRPGENREIIDYRSTVVTRETQLNYCTAHGRRYHLERSFQFTLNCYEFKCQCFNDGSWECPVDSAEYVCPQQAGQARIKPAYTQKMKVIVANNLQSCTVNGQEFPLNSRFNYVDGCILYNCICDRDGSWQCPADRAENKCQPEREKVDSGISRVRTDTRTRVVAIGIRLEHCTANGNQYPLEHSFSFREGCFQFNCQCYVNGSWECPSERSQYICQLQPGQRVVRGPSKKNDHHCQR